MSECLYCKDLIYKLADLRSLLLAMRHDQQVAHWHDDIDEVLG
jgi:hypothetical protein